jgi:TolB protein
VMDPDGGNQKRILTAPGFDGVPAWSPDGKRIAFQRGVKAGEGWSWDLFTIDATGGDEKRLTSTPAVNEQVPVFTTDGRELIVFSNHEGGKDRLFRMPAGGGAMVAIGTPEGQDQAASLSPDGRLLAFVSEAGGVRDLHVMGLDGTGRRRLTTGRQIYGASWSPDGRRLVFADYLRGKGEIHVIGVDGSGLQRITAGADGLHEP